MDRRSRDLLQQWSRHIGDHDVGRRYIRERMRAGLDEFEVRIETSGCFDFLQVNAQGRREWVHRLSGIIMVEVPAGSFMMGAPEDYGDNSERPQHEVTFHRPFLISKYTVKQGEWKRVMDGANPSQFQGSSGAQTDKKGRLLDRHGQPWDDHPVEGVDWNMAVAFCERVGLRLPTEAMWEYACRAGTTTRFHSGDEIEDLRRVGWFDLPIGDGHRACGLLEPNNWGLHDTHGNVFEWAQDRWHRNYVGAPTNGFIAWDDDTGYNHPLWVDGQIEDLTLHMAGARPVEDVADEAEDDQPGERRLVKYGLSVRLAPSPFVDSRPRARSPSATSTGEPLERVSSGETTSLHEAPPPVASSASSEDPTKSQSEETTPPSVSPGRSVPVDRASYGQYGVTEHDLFLGREAEAGEIRAQGPQVGDVPARSDGTSPVTTNTDQARGPSRRRRSGDAPSQNSRRNAPGSRGNGRGRSSGGTARASSSDSAAPQPAHTPFDPRSLIDPGFDWSGLEDPLVDAPLRVEEPPVVIARAAAVRSRLRVRRGDVAWCTGGMQGTNLIDRNRSRNHELSSTGEQGFRVVWS